MSRYPIVIKKPSRDNCPEECKRLPNQEHALIYDAKKAVAESFEKVE